MRDADVVKSKRPKQAQHIVAVNPAMSVMRTAAESLALPGAPVAALVCAHFDAMTFNDLGVADNRQTTRIARRHRLIARIVGPNINGVGPDREQLKKPYRIGHVIEDPRSEHEIEALCRLLQERHEIAELEFCDMQPEQFLHHKALQKG